MSEIKKLDGDKISIWDTVQFIEDTVYDCVVIPIGTIGVVVDDDRDCYHPFSIRISGHNDEYIGGYSQVEKIELNDSDMELYAYKILDEEIDGFIGFLGNSNSLAGVLYGKPKS